MIAVPKPTRALLQYWRLSAVSAFSLAVAMAVGILGLSILNTILIMAPQVPEADRLLTVSTRTPVKADDQISYLDYVFYRDNNHSFSSLAAAPNSIGVRVDNNFEGREIKVVTRPVSVNYFAVMGIRPHLGAFFAPDPTTPKRPWRS